MSPALLRQATYGSLKLGLYHALKRMLVKDPKGKQYFHKAIIIIQCTFSHSIVVVFSPDEKLYLNVLAGVIGGSVASAICNPTDVLKVILSVSDFIHPSSFIYFHSLVHSFNHLSIHSLTHLTI